VELGAAVAAGEDVVGDLGGRVVELPLDGGERGGELLAELDEVGVAGVAGELRSAGFELAAQAADGLDPAGDPGRARRAAAVRAPCRQRSAGA
jgi:hypothetical protein